MSEVEQSTTVAVMNQVPSSAVPQATPLQHTQRQTGGPAALAEELPLQGLLIVRGNAQDKAFPVGIKQALGVALPPTLCSAVSAQPVASGGLVVLWIAPDEWWIQCPYDQTFALENTLRETLSGHFAVVNNTAGQSVIRLSGPDAVNVLKKSMPYDFHPDHFHVGKVITSVFAKTQAVVRRSGEQEWELLARRSFADYIWRWLEDACRGY